ncbi:hypothetical protein CPA52_06455 [Pseudoalteromonas marina]|nr:hypothetical protein CPA52_06455 [Pseudoalteromonas marina]
MKGKARKGFIHKEDKRRCAFRGSDSAKKVVVGLYVFSFVSLCAKVFYFKASFLTSASSTSSAKVYIWVLLLDALLACVMGKSRK